MDPGELDIEFATDLNKTSIKHINKKNITNIESCFSNKSIFDYILINKILRELIFSGKIKKAIKLLKDYHITIENIKSLLKIDKIKTTKNTISTKQKKELLNELEKIE